MLLSLMILFYLVMTIRGKHFNGGTINWAPINPYNNSTSVPITITQTYSWTYPYVSCAHNVPISTSTFAGANRNLTCVVDCTTDGGYSTHPINILTDCTSASTSLNMLSSTRSKNITLNAGAHFYLAYLGTAWVSLNYPAQSGLEWSIVTFIDLRMRPDGFINTPPVASVISPQYAFVNQTIQIKIPVSDANAGDDVRCRWARYTTGYRKRKRSNKKEYRQNLDNIVIREYKIAEKRNAYIRKIRNHYYCDSGCGYDDHCTDPQCTGTVCGHPKCQQHCCEFLTTTTKSTTTIKTTSTTTSTITTTTTDTTTSVELTTTETLGTLKSTSTYPVRQAINECGGICYPESVPNDTTLSNCTINFTGRRAGVWYAVAIQVCIESIRINIVIKTKQNQFIVDFLRIEVKLFSIPDIATYNDA